LSGRKTFTAGEVLQAADVNDFLMDQSVMVFAGTAARGSAIPSPSEGMVTYRSDDDAVEVYDGSSWNAVGPGKILQVVSTTKTDTFTKSVGAFSDLTGLSVIITPNSTSSKVLVSVTFGTVDHSTNGDFDSRLDRNGTIIGAGDTAGSRNSTNAYFTFSAGNRGHSAALSFLDSPASTSALTYKIQLRTNTGTLYVNRSANDVDSSAYSRTSCTITVMEVAG